MSLHRWYHQRLALADMATERFSIVPLPDETLTKAMGGAVLGSVLHQSYPDAFLVCAGPLTGSFAPASGLAVAVFPRNGELVRLPVLQGIGAALRQCGVDALALVGRAENPLTLRLHRGTGRLERAQTPRPDSPRTVRREELLRMTQDGNAALLLAGAPSSELRGAGMHFGSAPQAFALAGALQDRNCAALVFEGGSALPPMPVPVDIPLRARLASQACFAEECAAHGVQIPAGTLWKARPVTTVRPPVRPGSKHPPAAMCSARITGSSPPWRRSAAPRRRTPWPCATRTAWTRCRQPPCSRAHLLRTCPRSWKRR